MFLQADRLFSTVGVHPTRCNEFEAHPEGPEAYMAALLTILKDGMSDGKIVAIGECGLDYDRLHFCPAETQRKWFEAQFGLAKMSQLPMFLHLRAATKDFMDIISKQNANFKTGVVHSFDGSLEELHHVLINEKLSIGINGCSLKTPENLQVMTQVPVKKLMLETDCPWCDIRPTHAGSGHIKTKREVKDRKKHDVTKVVKGRNEPCNIVQVLEVVAGVRGVGDVAELAEQVYLNADAMFFAGCR